MSDYSHHIFAWLVYQCLRSGAVPALEIING